MAYLPGRKKYLNSAFMEHLIVEDCLECVTLVFTRIFVIVGPNNFSVVMELSKFMPGKLLKIYLDYSTATFFRQKKPELNIVQIKTLTSEFDVQILELTHSRGKKDLLHCNLFSVFN